MTDQYPDLSIKTYERRSRGRQGLLKIKIDNQSKKCPLQWKKFLSVNSNKRNLVTFLASEWRENVYAERLKHCQLFIAHGTKCSLVTSGDGRVVEATDVSSLKCSHEEADTRLVLHAAHAERCGYESIVIQSPDTCRCNCLHS